MSGQTKKCIACAEEIVLEARLCKHCGTRQDDPTFSDENAGQESTPSSLADSLGEEEDSSSSFFEGQEQKGQWKNYGIFGLGVLVLFTIIFGLTKLPKHVSDPSSILTALNAQGTSSWNEDEFVPNGNLKGFVTDYLSDTSCTVWIYESADSYKNAQDSGFFSNWPEYMFDDGWDNTGLFVILMYSDIQANCTQDAASALDRGYLISQAAPEKSDSPAPDSISSGTGDSSDSSSNESTGSDNSATSQPDPGPTSWIPTASNIIRCANILSDDCYNYSLENTFKKNAQKLIQKLVAAGICVEGDNGPFSGVLSDAPDLASEDACIPINDTGGNWIKIGTSDERIYLFVSADTNGGSDNIAAGDGWAAVSTTGSASLMKQIAATLGGKYAFVRASQG
jgi:hypothetical protein